MKPILTKNTKKATELKLNIFSYGKAQPVAIGVIFSVSLDSALPGSGVGFN